MKTTALSSCDVVVLADSNRLRSFYTRGKPHAFLTASPLAVLLPKLSGAGGRVTVITDREDEPLPAELESVAHARLPRPTCANVALALRAVQKRLAGDSCLIVDAAAPFLTEATLCRLVAHTKTTDVVALAGGDAGVALGKRALRKILTGTIGGVRNLPALVAALVSTGPERLSSKSIAPSAGYERVLGDIAEVHAAVGERRLAQAFDLAAAGLRLRDPATFDLRGKLRFGRNVSIDAHALILGEVVLGDDVTVGPHCILEDVRVGAGTAIKEFTTVTGSTLGRRCRVGPFARIRPGCVLGPECHIGNYVEMKTAVMKGGCKINHHSFIGDATLGRNVIIGAGSITCNFDGAQAQRTMIGDGAFVGSGVMMIAPITIGRGAFLAAGSTVTKTAPARSLTITRAKQVSLTGWKKKSSL